MRCIGHYVRGNKKYMQTFVEDLSLRYSRRRQYNLKIDLIEKVCENMDIILLR
jgi:hypothetical protein